MKFVEQKRVEELIRVCLALEPGLGWGFASHPNLWYLGSGALAGLGSPPFTPGGCCSGCAVVWHMVMLPAMASAACWPARSLAVLWGDLHLSLPWHGPL